MPSAPVESVRQERAAWNTDVLRSLEFSIVSLKPAFESRPGQLPAEMTREFAHPSSLTTQPEEKLKAQPIIAAKLLLRCKNWRRSRERIRAAAYRRGLLDSDGPGRIRGLARFSCGIQPRSRRRRNRKISHHPSPSVPITWPTFFCQQQSPCDEQAPLPLKAVPERIMGFVSRAEAPRLILGCICT